MEREQKLVEFLCAVCGAQGLTTRDHPDAPPFELPCPVCGRPLRLLHGFPEHSEPVAV